MAFCNFQEPIIVAFQVLETRIILVVLRIGRSSRICSSSSVMAKTLDAAVDPPDSEVRRSAQFWVHMLKLGLPEAILACEGADTEMLGYVKFKGKEG